MTDEELQALRTRMEAAQAGPWTVTQVQRYIDANVPDGFGYEAAVEPIINEPYLHLADAEFIAAARMDIPALLAEVDRLKTLLVWCDEHMTETVPPLPGFSGPDLEWQEIRLRLRAFARSAESPKAG
jgi:hypothetical protein